MVQFKVSEVDKVLGYDISDYNHGTGCLRETGMIVEHKMMKNCDTGLLEVSSMWIMKLVRVMARF